MSASVSGSLTRVQSLVRKAGTLLGPAAPGPTGRSILGSAAEAKVAAKKRGLAWVSAVAAPAPRAAPPPAAHTLPWKLAWQPPSCDGRAPAGAPPARTRVRRRYNSRRRRPAPRLYASLRACAGWPRPRRSPIRVGGAGLAAAHEARSLPEAAVRREPGAARHGWGEGFQARAAESAARQASSGARARARTGAGARKGDCRVAGRKLRGPGMHVADGAAGEAEVAGESGPPVTPGAAPVVLRIAWRLAELVPPGPQCESQWISA